MFIWTQEAVGGPWSKRLLKEGGFSDVVWRVSWSNSGAILAVSCGDNKVSLWKENLEQVFEEIGDLTNQ